MPVKTLCLRRAIEEDAVVRNTRRIKVVGYTAYRQHQVIIFQFARTQHFFAVLRINRCQDHFLLRP